MNHQLSFSRPICPHRFLIFAATLVLFPLSLAAHPGHHHPDETDEFDAVSAYFLHSHGALDYAIAGLGLLTLLTAVLHHRWAVRCVSGMTAVAMFLILSLS